MNKFIKRIAVGMLSVAMLLGSTACGTTEKVEDPVSDNYRSFYQVFVGSFSDSNNDGIGDLRGIINRFDYLNDGNMNSETSLGVQGIWLSPIFTSPSYHKYDAKDYYEIDWRFGTEEDLKELIELCHSRNVKIILDLAINHTSNNHEWFLEFKEARMNGDETNPYYDYYSCATEAEKQNGVTYQKIAGVDCSYECNFSTEMPELNFDNEEVRRAMVDVAKYYMDLGVDGFRFDAVKYIYFGDTPKSVDFWIWYMDELKAINPDVYCVGECWSGENEILEYYPAMNCFNFTTSQAEGLFASTAKGGTISKYTKYVETFQKKVLEKNSEGMVMSFLSNHDMDRIAGTFILDSNMRMAANLYLLSPGSPVIYYGEELGMRGSRGGEMTDANRRLAMLWGDGDLIRDPEGTTYPADKQISATVSDQMEDEGSLFRYYCKLLTIRHKYPAIARGVYTAISTGDKNLGGFTIEYEGENFLLLHNNGTETVNYDLGEYGVKKLLDFVGSDTASFKGTVLTLGPQTSVIMQ